jgi:hypothetical protein
MVRKLRKFKVIHSIIPLLSGKYEHEISTFGEIGNRGLRQKALKWEIQCVQNRNYS